MERKTLVEIMPGRNISQEERMLYYWANPWIFVNEVITEDVLNRTTQAGIKFLGFIPQQREYLRAFCDIRIPAIIMKCNRGGSKTWLNALGILIMTYLVPKMKVTILAGSKEQADTLYQFYTQFLWDTPLGVLVKGDPTQSLTRYKHGGWVKSLTASERSVRGKRPDILVLDETCQADSALINAAIGTNVAAARLKIIFCSTPNKIDHIFYRNWQNADRIGWAKFEWSCYDCPWISPVNIDLVKDTYDKNTFKIEMLGEFGSATGTVFDHDSIYAAFVDEYPPNIIGIDGTSCGEEIIASAIGVDWGWAHPTVVTTVGVDSDDTMYILDTYGKSYVLNSVWQEQIIPDRVARYDPAQVLADAAQAGQNRDLSKVLTERFSLGVQRKAFNKYKARMLTELIKRFEKGTIKVLNERGDNTKLYQQLIAYEYRESSAEGGVSDMPRKGNDDYIDSLMLATWALRPDSLGTAIGHGVSLVRDIAADLSLSSQSEYSPEEQVRGQGGIRQRGGNRRERDYF
jgi:hypothetical protein